MADKIIASSDLPRWGIVTSDKQRKRLELAGEFPRRVKLTARSHGYAQSEIERFIADRIAARDTAA